MNANPPSDSPDTETAATTALAPGTGSTRESCLNDRRHEPSARIRDRGSSCVADQRDRLSARQASQDGRDSQFLVVLMQAEQLRPDVEVAEQPSAVPRVLGRDDSRLAQDPHGAKRHVLEVSDRRRDHEERASHEGSLLLYH